MLISWANYLNYPPITHRATGLGRAGLASSNKSLPQPGRLTHSRWKKGGHDSKAHLSTAINGLDAGCSITAGAAFSGFSQEAGGRLAKDHWVPWTGFKLFTKGSKEVFVVVNFRFLDYYVRKCNRVCVSQV